jgi:predicted 3-demethylubiquinone-9 3-methyltransferase (glyoxalase superfamily)
MKTIVPFLWFEKDIDQVISYYKSIFPDVTVGGDGELDNTPSGHVQMKSMYIYGQQFDLMTAGPYLPFNPTVSFIINCETAEEADDLWHKIVAEGKELMPLGSYDFAEKFGWGQDKYGVSWQVLCMKEEKPKEKIVSTLMFCGDVCGKAKEAVDFYTGIFKNSHVDYVMPYDGTEPVDDERAQTKHAGFMLDGTRFAVLDSGKKSPLTFNQAISFVVNCKNQEEVDYYWEKLYPGLDDYHAPVQAITAEPVSSVSAAKLPGLNGEVVEQKLGGMLLELQGMSRSMMSNDTANNMLGELQGMSKNLGALKSLQEIDFSGTGDQIKKMSNFYVKLNEAMADIADTTGDIKVYKNQIAALNKNLGSLNNVYGSMLNAMANIGK